MLEEHRRQTWVQWGYVFAKCMHTAKSPKGSLAKVTWQPTSESLKGTRRSPMLCQARISLALRAVGVNLGQCGERTMSIKQQMFHPSLGPCYGFSRSNASPVSPICTSPHAASFSLRRTFVKAST